jgi:hypothetical protein
VATWSKIEVGKKPDVLVTCAGWSLKLDASVAWANALAQVFPSDPSYKAGGVGVAYAVTGPPASGPAATAKIAPFAGVAELAAALRPHLDGSEKRIYLVAHSSGTAYADFIFDKLGQIFKAEKAKEVPKQVWYYNLDGGWDEGKVLSHPIFAHAFTASGFIKVKDKGPKPTVVNSLNHEGSKSLGGEYAKKKLGRFLEIDLSDRADPTWPHLPGILHMALINSANPMWLGQGDKKYFGNDINPTYLKATKANVTADYFAQSFK